MMQVAAEMMERHAKSIIQWDPPPRVSNRLNQLNSRANKSHTTLTSWEQFRGHQRDFARAAVVMEYSYLTSTAHESGMDTGRASIRSTEFSSCSQPFSFQYNRCNLGNTSSCHFLAPGSRQPSHYITGLLSSPLLVCYITFIKDVIICIG